MRYLKSGSAPQTIGRLPDAGRSRIGEYAAVFDMARSGVERDDSVVARITGDRMVGRREELALLVDLAEAARRGDPAVVLISGDAGIGKTRLASELVTVAGDGFRPVVAHCDMPADAAPLSALVELVRAAEPESTRISGAAGVVDAVLYGRGEPPSPLGMCEGMLQVVESLSRRTPTVLVVEDLHWADATTRNVVGYVARRLGALPVLLVLTYRSDELHRRHPLRPFLAELERKVNPHRVELLPLDRGGLAELAEGVVGSVPGTGLLDRIVALSNGNPFFAEELLAAGSDTIPSTVRDVVLGRIASLGAAEARLLRLASASGSTVHPEVLAEVAGAEEGWLQDRLRRLVQGHHLVASEDGLRFRHALAQEVLYDELLPAERSALHAAYAAALFAREPRPTGQIAYHLWQAGDREASLAASIEAGEAAVARGAHAEGLVHYERALEAWDVKAASDAIAHHELVITAAECAEEIRDFDHGIALLEQELDAGRLDSLARTRLGIALARLRWHADRPDVLDPLDAVSPGIAPDSPEAARLLLARGFFMRMAGKIPEALEAFRAAQRVANHVGAEDLIERVELRLGLAIADAGDSGALEIAGAARRAAEQGSDRRLIAEATMAVVIAANRLGEFRQALEAAEAVIELTRTSGTYLVEGMMAQNHRLFALERLGHWDDAETSAATMLDELGQFAHPWLNTVMWGVGSVWVRRGTPDPEGLLDRGHRSAMRSGFLIVVPSRTAPAIMEREAAAGRYDVARATGAEAIDALLPGFPLLAGEAVATAIMVEADRAHLLKAGSSGDGDAGGELAADWRNRLRRGMSDMIGIPRHLAAYAARADLELARLDSADDAETWTTLAGEWSALDIPYEVAYARFREAEARLRGTRPDRGGAARALNAGLDIAIGLKAVRLADAMTRLGRYARIDLGPAPAPAADPVSAGPHQPALTAREFDVLRLLVEGLSNGEIGLRLFITTKTASTHVSSILRKLGASNRVEAATIAHRLGMVE